MKTLMSMLLVLVVLTLAGCGQRVIVKQEKKEAKDVNAPAEAAQTPYTQSTPSAAESPAAPPASQPVSAPAAQAPANASPAPSAAGGEFSPDMVGGKSIGAWVLLLDSKNKDEVIEACNALGIARGKATGALPKLEALAKSTDKEIAEEAAGAIKKISGK